MAERVLYPPLTGGGRMKPRRFPMPPAFNPVDEVRDAGRVAASHLRAVSGGRARRGMGDDESLLPRLDT